MDTLSSMPASGGGPALEAAGVAAAAPKPPASAIAAFYDFIKAHVVVANNIVLASGTLVAVLDFLAPRLWIAPTVVYSATASLLALMVAAGCAPALVDRLISAMGYQARRLGTPLWRKPVWQFVVAILLGVSVAGFASVAKADKGGLMASAIPAVRSLQESMLGLRRDMADIRSGVDAANAKLDGMAARSNDPQRDLASLGYPYDDHGLLRAIKQADRRALGLFVQAGYRVEDRIPILNILNGDYLWSSEIVGMLPRSMFASPAACDDAGFLNARLREPAAERVAAFKRLCPVDKQIGMLRSRIELDRATPPASEQAAKDYEARRRTLAILEG